MQKHANCCSVTSEVKNNTRSFSELANLVNDPHFLVELEEAPENLKVKNRDKNLEKT